MARRATCVVVGEGHVALFSKLITTVRVVVHVSVIGFGSGRPEVIVYDFGSIRGERYERLHLQEAARSSLLSADGWRTMGRQLNENRYRFGIISS